MALSWNEVTTSQGYRTLSNADKANAAKQYFNKVVAPQASPDALPEAAKQFSEYTGFSIVDTEVKPKEEQGIIGDFVTSVEQGFTSAVKGDVKVADLLLGGTDATSHVLDWLKEKEDGFIEDKSTAQKASEQKTFVNDDGSLGDAWTDPRAYLNLLGSGIGSLAAMIATGGPLKGVISKGAGKLLLKDGMKEGAKKALKGKIDTVSGIAGYGLAEGGMTTGMTADQIETEINNMPQAVLEQSALYKEVLKDSASPDEARGKLARQMGIEGAKSVAIPSILLGSVAGHFLNKSITGKLTQSRLVNTAILGGVEMPTEAAQGATEQYVQNIEAGKVDPSIAPSRGVANAGVMEGIGGGLAGGLMGSVSRLTQAPQAQPEDVQSTTDVIDKAQADLLKESLAMDDEESASFNQTVEELTASKAKLDAVKVAKEVAQTTVTIQPKTDSFGDAEAIAKFDQSQAEITAQAALPADHPYLDGTISDEDLGVLADSGVREAANALMIRKQAANAEPTNQSEIVPNDFGAAEVAPVVPSYTTTPSGGIKIHDAMQDTVGKLRAEKVKYAASAKTGTIIVAKKDTARAMSILGMDASHEVKPEVNLPTGDLGAVEDASQAVNNKKDTVKQDIQQNISTLPAETAHKDTYTNGNAYGINARNIIHAADTEQEAMDIVGGNPDYVAVSHPTEEGKFAIRSAKRVQHEARQKMEAEAAKVAKRNEPQPHDDIQTYMQKIGGIDTSRNVDQGGDIRTNADTYKRGVAKEGAANTPEYAANVAHQNHYIDSPTVDALQEALDKGHNTVFTTMHTQTLEDAAIEKFTREQERTDKRAEAKKQAEDAVYFEQMGGVDYIEHAAEQSNTIAKQTEEADAMGGFTFFDGELIPSTAITYEDMVKDGKAYEATLDNSAQEGSQDDGRNGNAPSGQDGQGDNIARRHDLPTTETEVSDNPYLHAEDINYVRRQADNGVKLAQDALKVLEAEQKKTPVTTEIAPKAAEKADHTAENNGVSGENALEVQETAPVEPPQDAPQKAWDAYEKAYDVFYGKDKPFELSDGKSIEQQKAEREQQDKDEYKGAEDNLPASYKRVAADNIWKDEYKAKGGYVDSGQGTALKDGDYEQHNDFVKNATLKQKQAMQIFETAEKTKAIEDVASRLAEETTIPEPTINTNNKPFKSQDTATMYMRSNKLTNHDVVPVEGGYGIQEIAANEDAAKPESIYNAKGKPFANASTAKMAIKRKKLEGYEPVQVEGGYALQAVVPEVGTTEQGNSSPEKLGKESVDKSAGNDLSNEQAQAGDMIDVTLAGRTHRERVLKTFDTGKVSVDIFGVKYLDPSEYKIISRRNGEPYAPKQDANQPTPTVTDPADVQEIKNSYSLDAHKTLYKRIFNGDNVTSNELKHAFKMVVDHKDKIITELSSMTKNAILERHGGMFALRNKNEKKADVIDSAYRDMITDFTLGQNHSYSFGEDSNIGIQRVVDATTDDFLTKFADDRKDAAKERVKQTEEREAGMKEPQTIEDYHNILRQKKAVEGMTYAEARLTLTLSQREAYDTLAAEESRTERKNRKESQQADAFTDGGSYEATDIIQTKHTKLGHDLWQFQLVNRIDDKAVFKALVAQAKQLGGNYSSYRGNGAITGWQFRTEEAAQAFKGLISGNSESAKDVMKKRRDAYADDKSQSATERLNEMAGSLESRAKDKLNQDRKTNTSRRASMAAHAEAGAESDISLAKTMRNIATAISEGNAKFLDLVRQKVQVEALRSYVNLAHARLIRDKYDSYNEQEKHKHDPVTVETADYTDYPSYTMYRSDLATLARKMMETAGSKQDGAKLLKVADDVSKEYIKFARENMHKVSRYSRSDGTNAVFTSKPMADKSLQRSGFKGKAVVLPFKRGQNIIIMSPSEAMKEGIWEGDNDKRITLREVFGDDIVSKLGKEAPWQFKHVREQLHRLRAMGIETPAEHRAALREFIGLSVAPKEADKVKTKEREMIGRKNDGLDFFPTPAIAADKMVAIAEIKEGMKVLEPSAGWGHIADKIKEAGVTPDVIELSGDRRELLELKGYDPVASDFMEYNEGGYDRIIMNPPFSDRRDMEHIQHAYDLLKHGGRLISITGEGVFFGKDKKAIAFREWLEEVGATDEKMDEGTFNDANLPVTTGVNSRMVVIDKSLDENSTPLYSIGNTTTGLTPEATKQSLIKTFGAAMARAIEKGKVVIHRTAIDAPEGVKKSEGLFSDDVDSFVNGSMSRYEPLKLGETPEALMLSKAKGLQITMSQKVANKIINKKHDLPIDLIKQIPHAISDPIMVFKSASQEGALVVMTELQHQGKTVVVTLHLDVMNHGLNVNAVGSVHPRNSNTHFTNWIDKGLLRYANKEKSRYWFKGRGLQLPNALNQSDSRADYKTEKDLTQAKFSKDGKIQGWFDKDGTVNIVAENNDESTLAGVLLHEAKHSFDESAKGKEILAKSIKQVQIADKLARNGKGKVAAWVQEAKDAIPSDTPEKDYYHELFAYAVQQYQTNIAAMPNTIKNIVKRYLEALGGFIRAHLLNARLNVKITPATLVSLARGEVRQLGKREGIFSGENAYASIAKEYGITVEEAKRQYDAVVAQYKGTDKWMKASNGKDTKLNERQWVQVRTTAFKEWFGGSEEVDDNGEPIIFTHSGYSTITHIGESEQDRFGGIFAFESSESDYHDGEEARDTSFFVKRRATYYDLKHGDFNHDEAIDAVIRQLDFKPSEAVKEKLLDYIYDDDSPMTHIENEYDPYHDDPEMDELLEAMNIEKTNDYEAGSNAGWEIQRLRGVYAKALGFDAVDMYDENGYVVLLLSGSGVKSATANTGQFNPNNSDIRYSKSSSKPTDSIESGNLGGIPEETRIEKWQRVLQDGFNRIKTVQSHLDNVNESNDVYKAEERSSGKIAARLDDLDKEHLKPLLQSMRESGVDLKQMDAFLMARHAKERNEYVASINPDMQDGGSGISTAEAENTLASFSESETKALKALAEQVYAVNRLHVETMLKGHLINSETANLWTNQYQYYVPLKGKEGSDNGRSLGTGYQIKNSGIQKVMGRGDGNIAESPLTHVFAQAESAIVRAEKNKIGQHLLKLVLDNADPTLWSYTKTAYDKFMTLSGDMAEGYTEPQANMVEGRDYHRVKGINPKDAAAYRTARKRGEKPAKPRQSVYYAIDPQYNNREDVFTTLVDGEKYAIQIKDTVMMEQLKKLNASKMSEVVAHAGTLNRYLAMVNTALNPEFVITNLERDLTAAGINMGGEHGRKMAVAMAKSLPSAMKGIHNSLFGDGSHPMAKTFQDMKHAGGAIGFFGLEDTEVKIKKINARLHDSDAGAWASSKRNVAKLRDTVIDANQVIENASRLAAYKVAIDNGFTKNQAASISKNLTVNFNRKGEAGAAINAGYLFFNASIQGSARIFTALKHPAVRKIVGVSAATAFALAAYNMSAGGEDDDGISKWEKVPDYIKQTNIVIMHSDGTYSKYKLPYGYNMFWYAGAAMHDLMYGKKTTAVKTAMNLATTALNAFNPLAGSDFLDTITPTILKPTEQSLRNKNFMGSNIAPEQKYARYDVPDSEKAWAGTNAYLKALSRMLNKATGGDEFHPGAIDVSPATIKHYIGWVTGGAGMTAYRTVDTAIRLANGDKVESKNIPFVRTIGGGVGTRFDTDRYYNVIGELNATNKQYDSLRHQDRAASLAFRDDHRDELRLYKRIYRVNKHIKRLREYKRLATTLKKTDEVNKLNQDIAKIMRQFTSQYAD